MRQAIARPKQPQLPNNLAVFINRALRDAATAPTVYDALDVCADALATLAALARMEGRRHVD
ncbi:hypothetical protein SB783_19465 [Paraburkholderia sp. SIMBA_009]